MGRAIAAVARGVAGTDLVDAVFAPRIESSVLLRWTGDGPPSVSVLGPLTTARRKSFASPKLAHQLFIRPGHARRVFGVDVAALTDRIIPLQQVFGSRGRRILERLSDIAPHHAIDVLAAELSSEAADEVPVVGRALQQLRRGHSVGSVAAELAVGERQLRRLLVAELGLSPRRIARLARLDRVLRSDLGVPTWADTALDHGYCDQSHMIREFRELLQMTSEQYLDRRGKARELTWTVHAK